MHIIYKVKSNKSFQLTVADLKANLSKVGFGVLWELSFKDKLKEKGFDYTKEFNVLEACNPSKAIKVLETDQEAGFFLPCKLVVYESDEGIIMGMVKPTLLIDMLENEALVHIANEVESELMQAMDMTAAKGKVIQIP